MKKSLTIMFAALLSAAMIGCMAACNNGGGDQNSAANSTVSTAASNPFDWGSQTPEQSNAQPETVSDIQQSTFAPSAVSTDEPSVTESSVEIIVQPSMTSQPSEPDVIDREPGVSDTSDLPLYSGEDSDDMDESDDWDISDDDDDDDDESSFDIDDSQVTPKGTPLPQYAGTWSWQYDFDSLDPAEASIARAMVDDYGLSIEFVLNADGSVSMVMTSGGASESQDGGKWSAEGNSIYITFDEDTEEFQYSDGKMSSNLFKGGYFVKK